MLFFVQKPSPAFHYLQDKDQFLAQLIKSHCHLPKALCLAIPICKNFSSNTSLCILSEFPFDILTRHFYSYLDWPAIPTSLCSSHPTDSQSSDSNSASSKKPSLATSTCDGHFLPTLIALGIIQLARYLSFLVMHSCISFVGKTFALPTMS